MQADDTSVQSISLKHVQNALNYSVSRRPGGLPCHYQQLSRDTGTLLVLFEPSAVCPLQMAWRNDAEFICGLDKGLRSNHCFLIRFFFSCCKLRRSALMLGLGMFSVSGGKKV